MGNFLRKTNSISLVIVALFLVRADFCSSAVLVSGADRVESSYVSGEPQAVSLNEKEEVAADEVEVISFSGSVQVRLSTKNDYSPVEAGMLLQSGDAIKTGPDSQVELGFDEKDQNVVRVEADTSVTLLLNGDEKIELLEGEVFSLVRDLPSGSAFEIKTPTAVAGARGTEWVTKVQGEETVVEAYQDQPYVKGIDEQGRVEAKEIVIAPGFSTSLRRFQPPAPVIRIPEARQARWQQMRQGVKRNLEKARIERRRPERGRNPRRGFNEKSPRSGVSPEDRRAKKIDERQRGADGAGQAGALQPQDEFRPDRAGGRQRGDHSGAEKDLGVERFDLQEREFSERDGERKQADARGMPGERPDSSGEFSARKGRPFEGQADREKGFEDFRPPEREKSAPENRQVSQKHQESLREGKIHRGPEIIVDDQGGVREFSKPFASDSPKRPLEKIQAGQKPKNVNRPAAQKPAAARRPSPAPRRR